MLFRHGAPPLTHNTSSFDVLHFQVVGFLCVDGRHESLCAWSLSIPISCSLQRSQVQPVKKGRAIIRNETYYDLWKWAMIRNDISKWMFAYLQRSDLLLQRFHLPLQLSILILQSLSVSVFCHRTECKAALWMHTLLDSIEFSLRICQKKSTLKYGCLQQRQLACYIHDT